jgi:nucleotide-binding universal stress UspA family protein
VSSFYWKHSNSPNIGCETGIPRATANQGDIMVRLEKILCPIDFFPASNTAANYAITLAKTYRGRLILLYVVEPVAPWVRELPLNGVMEAMTERATLELNKVAKRATAGDVPVDVVVRSGLVDIAVESLIRERGVDFVVMGTHGRRGLEKLFIGSTAERFVRKLQVPLMTIRTPKRGHLSVRHVLVATDFSEGTPKAVHYAVSIAKEFKAKVTLLHVLNELQADISGPYREPLLRSIREELQNLVSSKGRTSVKIAVRAETGQPARRILPIAKEENADLIVMSIHPKTFMDRLSIGSTAEKIIRGSTVPVLTIPSAAVKRNRRAAGITA